MRSVGGEEGAVPDREVQLEELGEDRAERTRDLLVDDDLPDVRLLVESVLGIGQVCYLVRV
jgi:hypothetical protein